MKQDFPLKSAMVEEDGFYRFTFFCSLCDAGHTTGRICASSAGAARVIAEQDARPYFNRCHRCGKWVCDAHYNESVFMCTSCAPRAANDKGGNEYGK